MNTAMNEQEWSGRTFLANVAQDLLHRFGNDMTSVTVVFPNKRARLFLNEELLSQTDSPMWAPRYATIGELFDSVVGDEVMEPIPAICRLYHIYKETMGPKAESLDMFWGWGEILLQDFEDIDKHLVDADALFLNALELNQMESLDFLTDNQREALERFFGSLASDNKTHLQERFTELWTIMPRLYHGLRENMPEACDAIPRRTGAQGGGKHTQAGRTGCRAHVLLCRLQHAQRDRKETHGIPARGRQGAVLLGLRCPLSGQQGL